MAGAISALLHGRLGRRRQEHAHRPPALRLQGHLRGPAAAPRADQPAPRRRRCRPRAPDRRPARRARAGHHHRRRLPLLRHADAASSSSPTRPATCSTRATWSPAPRPRTSRSSSSTPARASSSSPAATPSSPRCWASRTSSWRSTRWTWSATTRRSTSDPRPSSRTGPPSSTSTTCLHPDQRAPRRQRRARARSRMPWYQAALAALPPRARLHRLRPQPHRLPLPGPVGHPAADPRAPRLPRLCRPGRRRRLQAGRRGRRPALGQDAPRIKPIDDLRRRARGGLRRRCR